MSELLQKLTRSCFADRDALDVVRTQAALWQAWLLPVTADTSVGEDSGYCDDSLRIRDEMNKLSGADADPICQPAESLLLTQARDVRIATYYIQVRLHRDGERGLAEGLALLSGLVERFGMQLLPSQPVSRKTVLGWLAGEKMLGNLACDPEVAKEDSADIVAALNLLMVSLAVQPEDQHSPSLMSLINALESCLAQLGGMNTVVPQNGSGVPAPSSPVDAPQIQTITSKRDLLGQAKMLAHYLNEQSQGRFSAHRLMRTLRWDTVRELLPDVDGKIRLAPSRTESRNQLKRLYAQQNWTELLEQTDLMFSTGVSHLRLGIQWYLHQALIKAGVPWDRRTVVTHQDLTLLLECLPGLENLAWNEGTLFANKVMRNWIAQQVMMREGGAWFAGKATVPTNDVTDDALALEPEALEMTDSQGAEVALGWVQTRPGIITARQRLLLRLLMARVVEQYGKNEMTLLLLEELDIAAQGLALTQWESDLLFRVEARQLKLLRLRAHRHADKTLLNRKMEILLGTLVTIDPVQVAVLCDA